MVLEDGGRRVGRRQHLDVEALEQRARQELRALKLLDDFSVNPLRRLPGERIPNTEYLV